LSRFKPSRVVKVRSTVRQPNGDPDRDLLGGFNRTDGQIVRPKPSEQISIWISIGLTNGAPHFDHLARLETTQLTF
jgi:hypothetical protein